MTHPLYDNIKEKLIKEIEEDDRECISPMMTCERQEHISRLAYLYHGIFIPRHIYTTAYLYHGIYIPRHIYTTEYLYHGMYITTAYIYHGMYIPRRMCTMVYFFAHHGLSRLHRYFPDYFRDFCFSICASSPLHLSRV